MLFTGFFVCFLVTSKLSNVHYKQPNSAGAANTTLPGFLHPTPTPTPPFYYRMQRFSLQESFKRDFSTLLSLTLPAAVESGQLNKGLVGT